MGVAVVGAECVGELALELAAFGQLLDDVCAADELALDEDLRNRGPAGKRRELLAKTRIREDVDCGHRRTRSAQGGESALRVTAGGEARRAFHEERHRLGLDELGDLTAEVTHWVVLSS